MRVYMSRLPRPLRKLLREQVTKERPSIIKIYEAGRLLGLEKEDISNLLQRSNRPNARSLLRRYWYAFPSIAIVILLLLMFILWYISGNPGSPRYPSGTLYGVIGTKDFKKGISPLKTGNHS